MENDRQRDVNPSEQGQNGFTLLEAIVALSIGVVILTTLAVAINQVTESITRTERFALQNRLLNAGIMRALEDADLWTTLDATGFTPLRPNPSNFSPLSPMGNANDVIIKEPPNSGHSNTYTGAGSASPLLYSADASDWRSRGQPFTAFADVRVTDPDTQYANRAYTWQSNYRSDVSDPYDAHWWQPCFRQSWYRGDGSLYFDNTTSTNDQYCITQQSAYGNYSIFTNTNDFVMVGIYDGSSKTTQLDTRAAITDFQRWQPSMQKMCKYTLGWYGWFDYMPANAFLDYYDVWGYYGQIPKRIKGKDNRGGGNNYDGVDPDNPSPKSATSDTDPGIDDEIQAKFSNVDYYTSTEATLVGMRSCELRNLPLGIAPTADATGNLEDILNTARHGQFSKQRSGTVTPLTRTGTERAVTVGWYPYTLHVGICAPTPSEWSTYGTNDPTNKVIRKAVTINRYMGMGYASSDQELINTFPVLLGCLNKAQDLVSVKPDAWPKVTWGTRRFMKWGNMNTWCYVRLFDPISGRSSELQFPTIATTLRGARLTRGLDREPVIP